ncbi:MAG: hypothetical protein CVU54_03125 [Deltaproteobacteria bacterium HGW-Deltaproteobacteria-12]|jgi:hypothetical protein|nr:MAG: hypothetical protein CVU54_03125 [Deltaproteobacteria bacterium HGW-Deltaproteobacteria-12]
MKRFRYLYILLLLLSLPGCAGNIKNISAEINSTDSIIVGKIETVPILWEFSLYEIKSRTEDRIDIAGKGFGLTKADKLQNRGYLFKVARPGSYILRLKKRSNDKNDHDDILRFEVPQGKLVYFGTVRIVIDRIAGPFPQGKTGKGSVAFKYHYERITEDETLKYFAEQHPQIFAAYKDKLIRIPSAPRPTYQTLLPDDNYRQDKFAPADISLSRFVWTL